MNDDFERDYGRYLAGTMDPAELQAFERRVLADPAAAEEVFADRQLADQLTRRRRSATRSAGLWRWAVPAAAAVAMFLVARTVDPPASDPVWRGGGDNVVLVAPLGEAPSESPRFVWRRFDGAVRYRLELLDAGGRVVESQVVADTSAVSGSPLPRSGAWRVIALDRLGTVVGRSAPAALPAPAPR